MSMLGAKIDELMLEAYNTNSTVIWRDVLSTQEWKIVVVFNEEKQLFDISVKRRNDTTGAPE